MRPTDRPKDLDGLRPEATPIERTDHHLAEVVHRLQSQTIMFPVLAGAQHDLGVALLGDINAAHAVLHYEVEMEAAIEADQDRPCVDILRGGMSVTGARHQEHDEIQGHPLVVQAVKDRQFL